MRVEVHAPHLPESVTDATLLDWHYRVGDQVTHDSSLVELETDKVILDVPMPETGILREIHHAKGDIVKGGDLLAVIETQPAKTETQQTSSQPVEATPDPLSKGTSSTTLTPQGPVITSPAVRRLLMEHQLQADDIATTGRITRQDVLKHLDTQPADDLRTDAVESAKPLPGSLRERRVPISRLRARIAERMVESQQMTATLTTFNEVDLHRVFELRNAHRTRFEQTYQVKLGLMSFFVKATVEALKRYPIINASLDGQELVYHDYYDIGIAVTTERGLVVPVLRDADQLGFADIETAIHAFSQRGRDGKLSFEELTGGTFTITNGGIFGSMLSTPILNPPQSAILGMHAIKDRPVVEDGQMVIRPIIYLALSYDHRIIDGRDAVGFLFTLKELLEDPSRLLLGV